MAYFGDVYTNPQEARDFPFATLFASGNWCNAPTPADRLRHEEYLKGYGEKPILRINIKRVKEK